MGTLTCFLKISAEIWSITLLSVILGKVLQYLCVEGKSCTNVLLLDVIAIISSSLISLPPDIDAPPKPPKNMLNISSGVISASEKNILDMLVK